MPDSKFDVIVVGAGISGLLSALALSKEGKRVLVLEKSQFVGGNCRTYEVGDTGFFVDTGVHAITCLKGGPLVQLMDKYFSVMPKFVPHGDYYIREAGGLKKFPNTLQDIARFSIIPRKDRLLLTKLLIGAIADHTVSEKKDISVYAYVKDQNLSEQTLKFMDAMSYFLSGVSMKDTPVWRVLSGGGLMGDGERNMHKKISDFVKLALNTTYSEQGYPRGGIGNITKCIIQSLPKNADIRTGEEVTKIEQKGAGFNVITQNGKYSSDTVVYSGEAKRLSQITDMPKDWYESAKKIMQSKAMTIWLGLKKRAKSIDYSGSEVWFSEGVPYWAMPVSNYDPDMAPIGKQLVGFSSFIGPDEDLARHEKLLLETIYAAIPEIEKNVEMKHTQVMVPEKAAVSVGVTFPNVATPIKNLYLVGTDANMKSMGITRASYSVIEMLKAMGINV